MQCWQHCSACNGPRVKCGFGPFVRTPPPFYPSIMGCIRSGRARYDVSICIKFSVSPELRRRTRSAICTLQSAVQLLALARQPQPQPCCATAASCRALHFGFQVSHSLLFLCRRLLSRAALLPLLAPASRWSPRVFYLANDSCRCRRRGREREERMKRIS